MKNKVAFILATWFGSGLIPPIILKGMAGTYGSFFSLPLVWVALWLSANVSPWAYLAIILLFYFIGIWSVPITEIALGPRMDWKGKIKNRDQNQIVIDETLGMLITCWIIPFGHPKLFILLLAGFIYFRIFDIVKVPPTRFFDKLKTANGVMLDDAMAGIYAFILLKITILFF